MQPAFPASDYYDLSAPPTPLQPTTGLPTENRWPRATVGGTGWFPRSLLSIRDRRWPALPQRPRHGYAADFHRDLLTGQRQPDKKFPEPVMKGSGTHRKPAHIHRVRAGTPA